VDVERVSNRSDDPAGGSHDPTDHHDRGRTVSGIDLAVTVAAIAANGGIAVADLARAPFVRANSEAVRVPASWLTPLGLCKGAGALGLALGLAGVPRVGQAAAGGLVLFFVGAVGTHLRVGDRNLAFPVGFLLLAVAALVVAVQR
jgi:hypothetical protein